MMPSDLHANWPQHAGCRHRRCWQKSSTKQNDMRCMRRWRPPGRSTTFFRRCLESACTMSTWSRPRTTPCPTRATLCEGHLWGALPNREGMGMDGGIFIEWIKVRLGRAAACGEGGGQTQGLAARRKGAAGREAAGWLLKTCVRRPHKPETYLAFHVNDRVATCNC